MYLVVEERQLNLINNKENKMGAYVNPTDGKTAQEWLNRHGTALGGTPQSMPEDGTLIICLVNNGAFFAAGICFSESELECFTTYDGRLKEFYKVDKDKLYEVSNLEQYLPREG